MRATTLATAALLSTLIGALPTIMAPGDISIGPHQLLSREQQRPGKNSEGNGGGKGTTTSSSSGGKNQESVAGGQTGKACFIVGNQDLPKEVQLRIEVIKNKVRCDTKVQTFDKVPDVIAGNIRYSDIDFRKSGNGPLAFAMKTFKTDDDLANSNLEKFENQLMVYEATEFAVRSLTGPSALKVPKFFLRMQVARIKMAQGNVELGPADRVEHLLQKVMNNSPRESALFKQLEALAADTGGKTVLDGGKTVKPAKTAQTTKANKATKTTYQTKVST